MNRCLKNWKSTATGLHFKGLKVSDSAGSNNVPFIIWVMTTDVRVRFPFPLPTLTMLLCKFGRTVTFLVRFLEEFLMMLQERQMVLAGRTDGLRKSKQKGFYCQLHFREPISINFHYLISCSILRESCQVTTRSHICEATGPANKVSCG